MNTTRNSTTSITSTSSTGSTGSTRRRLIGAVAGLALVASACGGSDDAEPAAEPAPVEEAAPAEEPAPEPEAAPVEAAPTVGFANSDLGTIIVDQVGQTLYGFTPDEAGEPTCTDGCADAWPPYAVDGGSVPAGLDESIFSVVAHPSGVNQLKAGKWPLYYFAADIVPGDVNGQGSGDVWFVVADDGSLVKGAAGIAAPADDQDASTSEEASGGYDY